MNLNKKNKFFEKKIKLNKLKFFIKKHLLSLKIKNRKILFKI
jgi:hypothetical protein